MNRPVAENIHASFFCDSEGRNTYLRTFLRHQKVTDSTACRLKNLQAEVCNAYKIVPKDSLQGMFTANYTPI